MQNSPWVYDSTRRSILKDNNNNNNNNNKSGFKEPPSNQKPLKTLYNDGKKKEKKSEKNINVKNNKTKTKKKKKKVFTIFDLLYICLFVHCFVEGKNILKMCTLFCLVHIK